MRPVTNIDPATGRVTRSSVISRSACGKVAFTKRKIAAEVAAKHRREAGENVHVYHCKRCHCYHLGHVPGQPRLLADLVAA